MPVMTITKQCCVVVKSAQQYCAYKPCNVYIIYIHVFNQINIHCRVYTEIVCAICIL